MSTRLPIYALYGEPGRANPADSLLDGLHCERIDERSARHDWEIRPHQHALLCQFLYIDQGPAQVWLDGQSLQLAGPCLLWVPARVPHGFRFSPDVQGEVLTVLESRVTALLAEAPGLGDCLARPQRLPAPPGAAVAALRSLVAEYAAAQPWRAMAMGAALAALLLAVGRAVAAAQAQAGAPGSAAAPGNAAASAPGAAAAGESANARSEGTAGDATRARLHVARLHTLVEAQYRQQPTLAALAAQLGITATQLNRVCHRVLGHAALGVLHRRLLLQAQRELLYTTLSIKQVAAGLGFADAGYFSRFFQRHTGRTPSAWRAQAVTPHAATRGGAG